MVPRGASPLCLTTLRCSGIAGGSRGTVADGAIPLNSSFGGGAPAGGGCAGEGMTDADEKVLQLLRETRDLQAEHLRVYRAELDRARQREADGEVSLRAHLADMNAAIRRQARGRWLLVGVGVAVMAAVLGWTLSLR